MSLKDITRWESVCSVISDWSFRRRLIIQSSSGMFIWSFSTLCLPVDTDGVPLYDQPLEKCGKRDRKKVERYEEETKKEEEVKPAGNGVAFGDIPYINAMITVSWDVFVVFLSGDNYVKGQYCIHVTHLVFYSVAHL